jgi:hypothetical protein
VTTARIAYTHDSGFRSIPLDDVDPTSIGIRAGIVHGEIRMALRNGEALRFRRGMSLAVQEVAAAILGHGTPTPPPADYGAVGTAPAEGSGPDLDELPTLGGGCTGMGDAIVMVNDDLTPVTRGFCVHVEINSYPDETSVVSVWARGDQSYLLVEGTAPYATSTVVPPGTQFLEIAAPGRWSVVRD